MPKSLLTDDQIEELLNGLEFEQMVTADDIFYLVARAVEKKILEDYYVSIR